MCTGELTDFSATSFGDLAISTFEDSVSDFNLSVEEVLTSYIVNVSPSGIFALKFLAMGYPSSPVSEVIALLGHRYIPMAPRPMKPHDAVRDVE